MALIQRTDDLGTGIPVIDNQHQRIVECINKLHEAQIHHSRHDDDSHADLVRGKMLGIERRDQGSWLRQALQRCFAR